MLVPLLSLLAGCADPACIAAVKFIITTVPAIFC